MRNIMKNYKLAIGSILLGFLIGCYVTYLVYGHIVSDTLDQFESDSIERIAMDIAYDTPPFIYLVRKVTEGDIDEFHRITCLRVSSNLRAIKNELQPKYADDEKVKEAIDMATKYLAEMKESSKCMDV